MAAIFINTLKCIRDSEQFGCLGYHLFNSFFTVQLLKSPLLFPLISPSIFLPPPLKTHIHTGTLHHTLTSRSLSLPLSLLCSSLSSGPLLSDAQPTEAETAVWNQVSAVLEEAHGILAELQSYNGAGQEIREVSTKQSFRAKRS